MPNSKVIDFTSNRIILYIILKRFSCITWILINHLDRKSTRLNSSHVAISYAVFCLNPPVPTYIYTLSLHDALPISFFQNHLHNQYVEQLIIIVPLILFFLFGYAKFESY